MNTVQDKRHFYEAALAKVSRDAGTELSFIDTRKSPTFKRPADKVNDTSLFPDKKLDAYD